MRRTIAAIGMLLAASTTWAGNPGDGPLPGVSESVRSEAAAYAEKFLAVAQIIESKYVKPVSQAKLAEAALTGLYEAVREPLPAWVKPDLAQAKDRQQLLHILTTARERLGRREALRDQRAL